MNVVVIVFALLAAAVHVYIFVLESVLWTTPRARAVFGTTAEQAQESKNLAYNQGFYNLFLGIGAVAGVIGILTGHESVGAALIFASCGSMLAAAIVLVTGARGYGRPAAVQGIAPAIAVLALVVSLL